MIDKRKMIISAVILAGSLFAVFGILHRPLIVNAQDETTPPSVNDRISFGMVGITSGQTMRINVTNLLPRPVNDLPPSPIRVIMAFRGMNGNLVRNARTGEVIRKVVDLQSGDSAFLDVDYDALPPSPIRVQLRAIGTVQYPAGTILPSDISEHKPFMPSVEVINNANGRTQFAIFTHPAVVRGFNPQPDPPAEP